MNNKVVLETFQISKQYGNTKALHDVNLKIEEGQIYGLIGLNGSGKSTFMRIVCGLISATEGHIELYGKSGNADLQKQRSRLGQTIETPALYLEMTAYENVMVQMTLAGISDKKKVKEVLRRVGLTDTGNKKAKNFSLGMKQRLALAIALITEPKFLILDEPTNGLDPVGIIETRDIIKTLAQEYGLTILLSSHLLDELSQIATHYGILHQGKLVTQLSGDELLKATNQYIHIICDDAIASAEILNAAFSVKCEVHSNTELRINEKLDRIADFNKVLVLSGQRIEHLSCNQNKLEDYFLKITQSSKYERFTKS
ncbi:ATP-binding cassette domain-containing protein [Rhabdobacter roseus]|uniref:ABC-2 type transport system ATP-binding protein n=1 Tax=Rhabdobacter roseus TaxID=1655419 RepID=A0A840TSH7_9BACT|nr:ATP-binding cassette domain-containing protein [Rhabdobacter roseus]MBB5286254.1 ABC-2 type transport system ATP-binding protein [Rhabdobacter roseus]